MPHKKTTMEVLDRVFIRGDTTTIRVQLGVASLLWAVVLFWPGDTTFKRAPYAGMAAMASEHVWGAAYLIHAMGVWWRLQDKPRVGAGFVVNAYGLGLWIVTTGLITSTVREVSVGTLLEWTVLVAAFVALCRTGLNDEIVSP